MIKWLFILLFCVGLVTLSGMVTLASMPVQCKAAGPPVVTVHYESAPVKYDFSRSSALLSRMRSDTVNPYGPGAVTATEGLRLDTPTIYTKTYEQVTTYPYQNLICMTYDKVDVKIALKPTIFIASQWRPGPCQDAILGHEQKHIRVDHEIMDEFVPIIRQKIADAAADVGPVGPLDQAQEQKSSDFMNGHIDAAVNSVLKPIHLEMKRLQGQVDSLQEYQRVNDICDNRD